LRLPPFVTRSPQAYTDVQTHDVCVHVRYLNTCMHTCVCTCIRPEKMHDCKETNPYILVYCMHTTMSLLPYMYGIKLLACAYAYGQGRCTTSRKLTLYFFTYMYGIKVLACAYAYGQRCTTARKQTYILLYIHITFGIKHDGLSQHNYSLTYAGM
jgi:hypothetical protein